MIDSNQRAHGPASYTVPCRAPGRRQARCIAEQDQERRAGRVRGDGIGRRSAARLSRTSGWRTMPRWREWRPSRMPPSPGTCASACCQIRRCWSRAWPNWAGSGRRSRCSSERYRAIVEELQAKLREPGDPTPSPPAFAAELRTWLRHRLEQVAQREDPQSLLAQESLLRIMTAHVQIMPSGREFSSTATTPCWKRRCAQGFRSTTAAASAAAENARPGSFRARCTERGIPITRSPRPRRMPASCSCAATRPSATS